MAIFTSNEADASKIHMAENVTSNGTFSHWLFDITDSSGNHYYWEDTSEHLDQASTVTDQQVSNYIKKYLTGLTSYAGVEKITATPIKRASSVKTSLDQVAPGGVPSTDQGNQTN